MSTKSHRRSYKSFCLEFRNQEELEVIPRVKFLESNNPLFNWLFPAFCQEKLNSRMRYHCHKTRERECWDMIHAKHTYDIPKCGNQVHYEDDSGSAFITNKLEKTRLSSRSKFRLIAIHANSRDLMQMFNRFSLDFLDLNFRIEEKRLSSWPFVRRKFLPSKFLFFRSIFQIICKKCAKKCENALVFF